MAGTFHRRPGAGRGGRGTSLVEVMIAVVIVATGALAIISAIYFGIEVQQRNREYHGAVRAASDLLENTRKRFFSDLAPVTGRDVTIDDRGTAGDTSDDVTGTASLRFFLLDDTEVGVSGSPIPEDLTMIRAEATITWNPAGRRSSTPRTVQMSTLVAP